MPRVFQQGFKGVPRKVISSMFQGSLKEHIVATGQRKSLFVLLADSSIQAMLGCGSVFRYCCDIHPVDLGDRKPLFEKT